MATDAEIERERIAGVIRDRIAELDNLAYRTASDTEAVSARARADELLDLIDRIGQ